MAHTLAFDLAAEGYSIVSGLARGIDTAAHTGALAAEGRTVAVLGCGVYHVYPAANRALFGEIVDKGLLVSEQEPDESPRKHYFPKRNRIIAALSRAVIVVQAGEKSGALITARQALDMGREVLAVPGAADQSVSRGVHQLLRDGAALVETAADVLQELGDAVSTRHADAQGGLFEIPTEEGPAAGPAGRLRRALADGPAAVHDLARATGIEVGEVLAELCRMELGGMVRSKPGHRYELAGRQ
jgi:DNA processing protein